MALSKSEIRQMLREMNVKFDSEETYAALMQRLQNEHHRLWLKSMSGGRVAAGGAEAQVLKKRKKEAATQDPAADAPASSAPTQTPTRIRSREAPGRHRPPGEPAKRSQPVDKPAPGKPWKAAADGTEPFNRKKKVFDTVLRRARMRCEGCGTPGAAGGGDLEPAYILPLSQGGEHSIKNVVALCPACRNALQADPSPKTIKDLKRKTRSKITDSLQIVRKKPVRSRRPFTSRRK